MTDRKQNASNSGKHDSEFDRELAMVSRAYRAGDADADGPPAAMDDVIRAAARRAVKSGPRAAGKSWVSRWSVPLSAAALVVLTTSVGFLALEERPELAPPLPSEMMIQKQPSAKAGAISKSAPGSPSPVVEQAPAAPPLARAMEKKALAEGRNIAPRGQFAQAPTPMPERNRSEAAVVVPNIVVAEESKRTTVANSPAASAPASAPPPAPAKELSGFVADPATAIAAKKDNATGNAALAKSEATQDGRSVGLLAPAGASARTDSAATIQAYAQKAQPAAAPATVGVAAAPASPMIASRVATAPPVYATSAPPAPVAGKTMEPADLWLKRILELKKHSKAGELEEELAKFRKQYPNFKLPDELKTDK